MHVSNALEYLDEENVAEFSIKICDIIGSIVEEFVAGAVLINYIVGFIFKFE
jgi:hypothetical protein